MRSIPPALQTHLDQEVVALAQCLKITKTDGSVVRITSFDQNLEVGGDTYFSGVAFQRSAIQSTDTLSVDNAQIDLGLDDDFDLIIKTDFEDGLYDKATFELFVVNWEDTSLGAVYLKRGEFGDITFVNETYVSIQLRGLTQSLQRVVVEKTSPTCRVNFGGLKCGMVNDALRVRRRFQKVKTFDWYLNPTTGVTAPALINLSFESDGDVANGQAGITAWTHGAGSWWSVDNPADVPDGSYLAIGGDDGAGTGTGVEMTLFRLHTTTSLGMNNTDVDDGDYSVDLSAILVGMHATNRNPGRVSIEQLDVDGKTLKLEYSQPVTPDFEEFVGAGVTSFVLPGCRTIKIGLHTRKNQGAAADVGFDDVVVRFWSHALSTFDNAVYRTMRLPEMDSYERLSVMNENFLANGATVANGDGTVPPVIAGWTYGAASFWQVVATAGAVSPLVGGFMLRGGDNGSGLPSQEYTLYQDRPLMENVSHVPTALNIAAGWYYAQASISYSRLNSGSHAKFQLQCLDALDTVLATYDSGYDTTSVVEEWQEFIVGGRVVSGTTKLRMKVFARSPAGGADDDAAVVFQGLETQFVVTAFERNPSDSEYGYLEYGAPTLDPTVGEYSFDGDALVMAIAPVFAFAAVTDTVDQRTFEATAVSGTAANLYSGKITWLSGNNAGKTSFIRIWNDGTKQIKLYNAMRGEIQVGDKFVWAQGCNKIIDRCAEFGNAHNFRGEPYLPGPAKVIEFMTST